MDIITKQLHRYLDNDLLIRNENNPEAMGARRKPFEMTRGRNLEKTPNRVTLDSASINHYDSTSVSYRLKHCSVCWEDNQYKHQGLYLFIYVFLFQ